MAKVIRLPARNMGEQVVTKAQLAAYLGRSTRWVEQRVARGMPVIEGTDGYGRRRYNLRECEEWLAAGQPKPVGREDRLTTLDGKVETLAAQVRGLSLALREHIGVGDDAA